MRHARGENFLQLCELNRKIIIRIQEKIYEIELKSVVFWVTLMETSLMVSRCADANRCNDVTTSDALKKSFFHSQSPQP